jgi:hypothetical protein
MVLGEGENFFSREKKFSPSPNPNPFQDIMRDTRGLSFFMSENKKWFAS